MRLILRVAAVVVLFLVCVPLHYLWKLLPGHSPWPQLFLGGTGWLLGLRVRCEGVPLKARVLFVSNHVTWLDTFALGGATPAIFVARDDVERWPVFGWAAGLNDTLYVARHAKREVHSQADQLRQALSAGRAVALFPEGTTEGGHEVLPFRPSLFASLFPPMEGVKVQPVAIDYGDIAEEIAWVGDEPAGSNAKRVVGRKGTIPVVLKFLEPIDPAEAGDRKALAGRSQAEVVEALSPSEPGAEPLYAPR